MTLLIYSGLLYLFGISLMLVFKPEIMFTHDGAWKEFGLGRNKRKYTWMPFWLFSIIWAIISYVIIIVIASNTGLGLSNITHENNIENISKKSHKSNNMKEGYYILDANETAKRGVPKYIFLGEEAPDVIYNKTRNKDNYQDMYQDEF